MFVGDVAISLFFHYHEIATAQEVSISLKFIRAPRNDVPKLNWNLRNCQLSIVNCHCQLSMYFSYFNIQYSLFVILYFFLHSILISNIEQETKNKEVEKYPTLNFQV